MVGCVAGRNGKAVEDNHSVDFSEEDFGDVQGAEVKEKCNSSISH